MQNDSLDFSAMKRVKHFNPLFDKCEKAIPLAGSTGYENYQDMSLTKKSYYYISIDQAVQLPQKLFQCKSLCPIFTSAHQSFILCKGDNLWDFYRAKKSHQIILTQQQIWHLLQQITKALIHLQQFGFSHTHLKQYAIYRQSQHSYQLVYHPLMKSMYQLAQSGKYFWYDFYMSPEELNVEIQHDFAHTEKDAVFSLGSLVLNVMNVGDFNRLLYSRKKYEVDWDVVRLKLKNSEKKYSQKLISLVENCLKLAPEQRYGFRQVLQEVQMFLDQIKTTDLQYKMIIDEMIKSKLRNAKLFNSPEKITVNSNKQKGSVESKKKSSPSRQKSLKSSGQHKTNSRHNSSSKQNINVAFDTPKVKKWSESNYPSELKKIPISALSIYKISKQQSNSPKKNIQQEINFERGTFGGERGTFGSQIQSPTFPLTLSNRLKSHVLKESVQNQNVENYGQEEINLKDSEIKIQGDNKSEEQSEKQKLATFGSTHSNQIDQIVFQESSHNEKNSQPKPSQKNLQTSEIIKLPTKNRQNQDFISQQTFIASPTLLDLRQKQSEFSHVYQQIQSIKRQLKQKQKLITLQLRQQCLQSVEVLSKKVSDGPGVFVDGNLYFGQFRKGRRNGFGMEVFPEGEYFYGNFKDDLFHGQGFYYWNKNQYFLGLFENGKKVFGYLYGPKLNFTGQFNYSKKMNGIGQAYFKSGQQFVGYWKEGKKHGFGQFLQITGDTLYGTWQKGKQSGYGQYVSNPLDGSGYKLKAFWKNNEIISDVIIEYSNGNTYEGGFKDFKKHGKGLFTFKKGGYFKGTYYHDQATNGQLVYRNEQKYIGSLKNLKRHGFGQYHYNDGTIKKGNWVNDVRIQKNLYQK